jgi:hypothetical protein
MGGVGSGSKVAVGSREQVIQGMLVSAAQSAAKTGKAGLFLQKRHGNGG